MARIDVTSDDGIYLATVRGTLSARDLARLERACGPALEWQPPPLVVRLRGVTSIDEAAGLFLVHLQNRGVVIEHT